MSIDGRLFIGGRRVEGQGTIVSKSPSTLETIAEAQLAAPDQCAEAVAAAKAAYPAWRALPFRDKQRIFRAAGGVLVRRAGEAGRLLSAEKGSPLLESLAVEVQGSLGVLDYYARNAPPSLQRRRVRPHVPLFASKKSGFRFSPLGPTLIISPWNFPFLIPFYDVVSALVAGNSVVLRPSTSMPLVALLLGEILHEAGLPPGVLNIVVSKTAQAEEMIVHPDIQTVMFTGSVGVGKRIMELASRNLTKIVLELGGKDPMVVLKDADVERAARGAVWTAFMNCGQSCASIERVYAAREIAEAFTERVVALTRRIRVGDPLDPETDMGPMTTLGQMETVLEHIRDAREKGAKILTGGGRIEDRPGYFLQPTVLAGVDHSMKVMSEETFGPCLPIMPFAGEDEAAALANDSPYGLTASIWTRDRRAADRLADRLEAGSVTVNDHMFSFLEPKAIWGGIKQTGVGRSHGPYGLLNLANAKFVSAEFRRAKEQMWWFPYGMKKTTVIGSALEIIYGRGLGRKFRALRGMLPALRLVRKTISPRTMLRITSRFFK